MRFLVTGVAGFIGYHLALRLISEGHEVVGIDNLNAYYDQNLKKARLFHLLTTGRLEFYEEDISNYQTFRMKTAMEIDYIVHLAAQAGVRYSLENPGAYIQSNLVGFANVLEFYRASNAKYLFYASSSSVYGDDSTGCEGDRCSTPLSLYAATKQANELMAYAYTRQFDLLSTGLRFFSVYGPYGRPDLALFKFTRAILEGTKVELYNNGLNFRDCTYVNDTVEAIVRLIEKREKVWVLPALVNIGCGKPESNSRLLALVEEALGKNASEVILTERHKGDVDYTHCNTAILERTIGWVPSVTLEEGIPKFVQWYRGYYG